MHEPTVPRKESGYGVFFGENPFSVLKVAKRVSWRCCLFCRCLLKGSNAGKLLYLGHASPPSNDSQFGGAISFPWSTSRRGQARNRIPTNPFPLIH